MRLRVLCVSACALLAALSVDHRTAASAAPQDEAAASDEDERSTFEWRKQLKEWRTMIGMQQTRKKPPQWKITDDGVGKLDDLYELVAAIRDKSAVPAISATVREEPLHLLRAIWLAPLPYIDSEPARKLLVKCSIEDDANHVREAATQLLKADPNKHDTIPDYVQYLRSPKFCTRAAIAIREAGIAQRASPTQPIDPALADALIDALILTATEYVPVSFHWWYVSAKARPGGYHANWGGQRGTTMLPRKKPLQNPEVLATLKSYSQSDYGYDREAWRNAMRERARDAAGP